MAVTVDELVTEARRRLAAAPFAPPGREALLLLGRVLGWSEAEVLARGERRVATAEEARFRTLLERRLAGEPVAYLFGEKEFFGRKFYVDRRVLIPRPETEHLVETALAAPRPPRPRILDVGTGSGCLAVTLALEIPGARVTATDLSPAALAVAAANARRHGAAVRLVAADLAAGLDLSRFDLIVSNPPYIDCREADRLSPEITAFEPATALFPPGAGDSVIRRLLELERNLRPGAVMALEIGIDQLEGARHHAAATHLRLTDVRYDYAGIPRVAVFTREPQEGLRLG